MITVDVAAWGPVLVAAFTLLNTLLLVFHSQQLGVIKTDVNGAKAAATAAAEAIGLAKGVAAVTAATPPPSVPLEPPTPA